MIAILALASLSPCHAMKVDRQFHGTIAKVEQMTFDQQIRRMVKAEGLDIMNVTWEDTGRSKGSVWGPNISDMTIGVRDSHGSLHPMPVIRFDNFNDQTADVRSERFWLRVGNQLSDKEMRSVSLQDILKDTERYLTKSDATIEGDLWDKRDEHVLVSAQAAFLPIPRDGEATFTPVLYNYQSSVGSPAVMTIVATREGTSMQVVENDSGYMSEVLYFNEAGERAPFTATRLSDFKRKGGDGTHGSVSATGEDGLNTVMVIQVPLKFERKYRGFYYDDFDMEAGGVAESAPMMRSSKSDVEAAVIGHGATEGPFKELNGLTIERDDSFPVRVTVQFYKATSNGVVSKDDIADIRKQIDRVYEDGEYVGSLVTNGDTGRPTEWTNSPTLGTWAGGSIFSTGFNW